jgi:hypothetical protein
MTTPSFLVDGSETHRIEFGESSEWIDIRRSVTGVQGARWVTASIQNKVKITGRGKTTVRTSEQTQDHAAFMIAKLSDIVVDTSAGKVDVSQLSDLAVTRIFEEFDKLNPTDASEDETLGESESPSSPTTA